MNRAEQAQKGFKTFILTLSISLIVFSAVYYVYTNYSNFQPGTPDIESDDTTAALPSSRPDTVFGQLASQKINDVPQMAVLAGSTEGADETTEPTQSTGVPEGGVFSITVGLILSLAVFLFGMYVVANDPRRLALHSFERKVTRE